MTKTSLLPSENIICKLIDYILLNAYSVNSTGLYNGKAGLSLCLFEIARIVKDEYIEEHAYELLQESLISKNEDIGFENGLSGIGYVLLYLIENKFIDADFDELFNDNLLKIIDTLEKWEVKRLGYFSINIKIAYFLQAIPKNYKDQKSQYFLQLLINDAEDVLKNQFIEIYKTNHLISKLNLLCYFQDYLKVCNSCELFHPSFSLLNLYVELYKSNRFISDFAIGYYLESINRNIGDKKIEEIATMNKITSIENIYPEAMSFSQRLDILHLMLNDTGNYLPYIQLLEKGLFYVGDESLLEKKLSLDIAHVGFPAGYQSGIARLLLYYASRTNPALSSIRLL